MGKRQLKRREREEKREKRENLFLKIVARFKTVRPPSGGWWGLFIEKMAQALAEAVAATTAARRLY
jgi:hypothetical protein